jgi:hypothetical protein
VIFNINPPHRHAELIPIIMRAGSSLRTGGKGWVGRSHKRLQVNTKDAFRLYVAWRNAWPIVAYANKNITQRKLNTISQKARGLIK